MSDTSPAARIKKKILKGSAWVLAGKILTTVLGVVVNGFIARMLGPDEMGGFFVAFSIVMIGSTVSELGLNKTVVRLVAAGRARARPGAVRDAVRLTFLMGMLSALLLGTVLALGPGQRLALDLFNSQAVADAMPFVAGWMVAVTLETLVAETFRGFKNFWAATLFGDLLIDIFAVIVFGLMWAQDGHPDLSQVVLIMLGLTAGSSLIGALLLSGYLTGLRGRGHHEPREVLGISLPLMVVSLSSFFVGTGVDLWVIASFEPTDQVALYGSAAKLMFLVATPFIIISQVVPPIIAQLYEQRRLKELEGALRSTATLAGLPAAAVLIFMMVFGSWLLQAVYGSSFYSGAATVLVILGAARLFAVATGSCGVALTMTGHQKLMMWITMFSAVFSFGLELVLVQPFGITGVAIATLIAQVGQNSLQLFFTHREIGIWTQMEFSLRPVAELFGLSAKGGGHVINPKQGGMVRWAAKSRRRHHVAGAVLRTASPVLPRKQPPRDPVFVIGSPRSGTTMLLNMLDRSTALASLGMGSHFLWEMYHPFDPEQGHAVGPQAITDAERRTLNWTIDRICGGIRYLDKYPRMCLRVEYLHALYPDAWFVYISRDGRAAASSMMTGWRTEGKFGAGTDLPLPLKIEGYEGDVWKFLVPPGWREYAQGHTLAEVCAFQWSAANAAVLDAQDRIASQRFLSVRYEQLVERPTDTVGGLLDALGLPHDGVIEWASQLDQRVSRTAVTPPRPDKWRDENPAAIESVLDQLAPTMARLGYELDAVAV